MKLFRNKPKTADAFFFAFIFASLALLFANAFSMKFFADDYFFLKISRAGSIGNLLNFFSPVRDYFYRPLASEVFYWLLHLIGENVVVGHAIVFVSFFIGLFCLYDIALMLSGKKLLAGLTVFLYAVNFTHVFQLYWFATFQEVAVFAFLSLSFRQYLKKNLLLSWLFFVCALMSKEVALAYLPFILAFSVLGGKGRRSGLAKTLAIFAVTSFVFFLFYRNGLKQVTALENYQTKFNPKLMFNNTVWYTLWSAGFPNFMPDYFPSLLSKPLPAFWEILRIPYIKTYFYSMIVYWFLFAVASVYHAVILRKNFAKHAVVYAMLAAGYLASTAPFIFFPHKWMVRLTLPLIFISAVQALQIFNFIGHNKLMKAFAVILVSLYVFWNFFAVKTHESSSLYLMERDIYNRSVAVFRENKDRIENNKIIYFNDNPANRSDIYKNSQKLKNSFHGADFTDHFFPGHAINVLYGFEYKGKRPEKTYTINSSSFFPQ